MPPVLPPPLSPAGRPSDISRRSLIALATPAAGGLLHAAAGRSRAPATTGATAAVAAGAAGRPLATAATVHPGVDVYPEA